MVGKQRHWRLKGGGSLVLFAGVLYSSINGMDKEQPESPPDCPEFRLGNAEFVRDRAAEALPLTLLLLVAMPA